MNKEKITVVSEMSEKDKFDSLVKEIVRINPNNRTIFNLLNVLMQCAVNRAVVIERRCMAGGGMSGEDEIQHMIGLALLKLKKHLEENLNYGK